MFIMIDEYSLQINVVNTNFGDSFDQWIYWVGPFIGAAAAAIYHQHILRAAAIKALGSFRSNA